MIPIVIFPSILVEDEDDLANQITYPIYSFFNFPLHPVIPMVRSLKILDTETVIELGFSVEITNGSPKSLHRLSDNTNYSVTSGKTAKLIVIVQELTNSSPIELIEDATADAGTGTVKHTTPSMNINEVGTIVVDSIAATKFVTLEPNAGGDIMQVISAVAIES